MFRFITIYTFGYQHYSTLLSITLLSLLFVSMHISFPCTYFMCQAGKYENLESFEADDIRPIATNDIDDIDGEWGHEANDVLEVAAPYEQLSQPIDLSRDTYVNQILSDQGAPTNPDAEIFHDARQQPRQPRYFQNNK